MGTMAGEQHAARIMRLLADPEALTEYLGECAEAHADDPPVEGRCTYPGCDGFGNLHIKGRGLTCCPECAKQARQQAGARFAESCGADWSEARTWQTGRGGRETPLGAVMGWWRQHGGALRGGLLLAGGVPGAGRTTALIGLGIKLARMSHTPRYLDGAELLERGTDREPGDGFGSVAGKEFTRQMLREPALLIDDAFPAAGAAWQTDWLARFLDQRHRRRRDQLTVLSTVWPPARIRKGLSAQTADRLLSGDWLDTLELSGNRYPRLRRAAP